MTKREQRRIEAKKREWDLALRGFNRWVTGAKKELKCDGTNMINWLFFYKSKDKLDKGLHLFEVACFYVVLQFAWKGIFG